MRRVGRSKFESLIARMRQTLVFRASRWAWLRRDTFCTEAVNLIPRIFWRIRAATRALLKRYLPLVLRDLLFRYILPPSSTVVGNRRYIREPLDRTSFIEELE